MKKTLLLFAILLSVFLSETKAQSDTSKYDLGRLQIRKDLTQTVTIKGADLEKLPFTNLSEAVRVWLYGMYGTNEAYIPVINGIVMTDVNAYSIYDIDEITLVQNASASLNGAAPHQLMLLIKTRKNRQGKHGIEVAGQTNIINLHNPYDQGKSTNKIYNQYYLSGYMNTSKISAGVSANYQRDALPTLSNNPTSAELTRYKFNGYLDVNLGNSVLSVSAGYVPQTDKNSSATSTSAGFARNKKNYYYSNASLKTVFAGFTNTLTAGYTHYKETADQLAYVISTPTPYQTTGDATDTENNYLIKDNLSYIFKTDDWELTPALNLTYRSYKDTIIQNIAVQNGNTLSHLVYSDHLIQKNTLLTPALTASYRRIFTLQGGFETVLSNPGRQVNGFQPQRIYPFASAMLNLIQLSGKENSATGLNLYGSYARVSSYMTDIFTTVTGITSTNTTSNFANSYSASGYSSDNPYKSYNQWQGGLTFSLANNKVAFNYTYSKNQFSRAFPNGGSSSSNPVYNPVYSLGTHRFGIDTRLGHSDKITWKSSLNFAYINTATIYPNFPYITLANTTQKGHVVTGGFANRLNTKGISLGADILYLFRQPVPYYSPYINPGQKPFYNAFNLQNLYFGINFSKSLQVYANMRSMIEDSSPTQLDTRKYYGLGFKLGI